MRSLLALAATGLAAIGAFISALENGQEERAFFTALTGAGLVAVIALLPGAGGRGRLVAAAIAAAWATAGAWVGVLLVMYRTACACSGPPASAEATYLGLTATAYHLVAMYGSTALVLVAAFGRSRFLDRPVGRSDDLG